MVTEEEGMKINFMK